MAAEQTSKTVMFMSVFLITQAALPWILLWLSDVFIFDIPAWSVQGIVGLWLVMALVAGLTYLLHLRRRQLPPLS